MVSYRPLRCLEFLGSSWWNIIDSLTLPMTKKKKKHLRRKQRKKNTDSIESCKQKTDSKLNHANKLVYNLTQKSQPIMPNNWTQKVNWWIRERWWKTKLWKKHKHATTHLSFGNYLHSHRLILKLTLLTLCPASMAEMASPHLLPQFVLGPKILRVPKVLVEIPLIFAAVFLRYGPLLGRLGLSLPFQDGRNDRPRRRRRRERKLKPLPRSPRRRRRQAGGVRGLPWAGVWEGGGRGGFGGVNGVYCYGSVSRRRLRRGLRRRKGRVWPVEHGGATGVDTSAAALAHLHGPRIVCRDRDRSKSAHWTAVMILITWSWRLFSRTFWPAKDRWICIRRRQDISIVYICREGNGLSGWVRGEREGLEREDGKLSNGYFRERE